MYRKEVSIPSAGDIDKLTVVCSLAYAEMRVILARLVWNFDMKLSDGCKKWEEEELTYFFWEKGPLNVYLTPARTSAPNRR